MNKHFKIAALFVAAAISVAVVSCQKDKETEEPVASQSQNSEAKELLNRIYAFQELRDDVNSGAKSGESMTLEELRDNIDLTFNYEHSQHATPFANATLDTFYVRMPQTDANGNVTAAEAVATYNAFETNLENILANVNDDANLAKNFSIKFPESGAKSEDAIEVVFTRGGEGGLYPSTGGPFEEGDDFIWGGMLGHCDPSQNTGRNTDAANELSQKFKFTPDKEHVGMKYVLYDVEYGKYTPYYKEWYDYTYHEDPTNTCAPYWLFLFIGNTDEGEPCIPYDEMNCYWRSINRNIVSPNAPLHYSPINNIPYHECTIVPIDYLAVYNENDRGAVVKMHNALVTYANKAWLSTEQNADNN